MTTRERWIVYPLLFLTLGIALRDKIVPQRMVVSEEVRARHIRCGDIEGQRAEFATVATGEVRWKDPAFGGADIRMRMTPPEVQERGEKTDSPE